MAELFGRTGGYSKGKGGAMHMFDMEHCFYGGYGIVGRQIPLGAGMAFASRYRNEDRITLCFFGDAAASEVSVHETLKMASKWKLPVLFICENNRYGMGTAFERVSAEPDIYKRAVAYEMRGEVVDGMDVRAVYDMVKDCAAEVRSDKKPVLLEARTYRYRGHSMADPATYRTKGEVEQQRHNDPIPKLRDQILKEKSIPEEELDRGAAAARPHLWCGRWRGRPSNDRDSGKCAPRAAPASCPIALLRRSPSPCRRPRARPSRLPLRHASHRRPRVCRCPVRRKRARKRFPSHSGCSRK